MALFKEIGVLKGGTYLVLKVVDLLRTEFFKHVKFKGRNFKAPSSYSPEMLDTGYGRQGKGAL